MEGTLESALALAMDPERRRKNYEASSFSREWTASLRETVEFFLKNT